MFPFRGGINKDALVGIHYQTLGFGEENFMIIVTQLYNTDQVMFMAIYVHYTFNDKVLV